MHAIFVYMFVLCMYILNKKERQSDFTEKNECKNTNVLRTRTIYKCGVVQAWIHFIMWMHNTNRHTAIILAVAWSIGGEGSWSSVVNVNWLVFSQRMKLIFILHLRPLPSGMIARLGIREKKVSMKIARFLEIVVYFSPLPFFTKSFSLPKLQYQYLFLYVLYSYKVNCLKHEENAGVFLSVSWTFFFW